MRKKLLVLDDEKTRVVINSLGSQIDFLEDYMQGDLKEDEITDCINEQHLCLEIIKELES